MQHTLVGGNSRDAKVKEKALHIPLSSKTIHRSGYYNFLEIALLDLHLEIDTFW